ncbi:hypothetical protein GQ457_01G033100 [Hibiscus cannabinus]
MSFLPRSFNEVLYDYLWIPLRIQYVMNSQGIEGTPYRFIHGNNKEFTEMRKEAFSKPLALKDYIFPRVQPHIYTWINTYGKNYLSWNGAIRVVFLKLWIERK